MKRAASLMEAARSRVVGDLRLHESISTDGLPRCIKDAGSGTRLGVYICKEVVEAFVGHSNSRLMAPVPSFTWSCPSPILEAGGRAVWCKCARHEHLARSPRRNLVEP